MTQCFYERSGLDKAILGCDLGCNTSLINPTTKATGNVEDKVGKIIKDDIGGCDVYGNEIDNGGMYLKGNIINTSN